MLSTLLAALLPHIKEIAMMGGYALLEYWLGKTNKVTAGSAVELLQNGAKAVLGKLLTKQDGTAVAVDAKEVSFGEVGKVDIDLKDGIATIQFLAAPNNLGIMGGAYIKCSADTLLSALIKRVKQTASPPVALAAEAAKGALLEVIKKL